MKTQTGVHARLRMRATADGDGSRACGPWRAVATGMLAVLSTVPFASARADPVAANAQRLLGEYKCYICHADHEAKAGPAYADVAAQFRARRNAVSVIATKIRRGMRSGGPWHMPPHPEVSPADAKAMARYIVSLDRPTASTARR
jgi:cytochrome c